jgi:hypothetical protein
VVETIRLESGHTLTGIVGSNPTLSARFFQFSVRFPVLRHRNYFRGKMRGQTGLIPIPDQHSRTRDWNRGHFRLSPCFLKIMEPR